MTRRDQIPPLETGNYVVIDHPEYTMLLRGCRLISAWQAGWEDCTYNQLYANPYPVGSVLWNRYDKGNQDARKRSKSDCWPGVEVICDVKDVKI